jgi:hypothetical protein
MADGDQQKRQTPQAVTPEQLQQTRQQQAAVRQQARQQAQQQTVQTAPPQRQASASSAEGVYSGQPSSRARAPRPVVVQNRAAGLIWYSIFMTLVAAGMGIWIATQYLGKKRMISEAKPILQENKALEEENAKLLSENSDLLSQVEGYQAQMVQLVGVDGELSPKEALAKAQQRIAELEAKVAQIKADTSIGIQDIEWRGADNQDYMKMYFKAFNKTDEPIKLAKGEVRLLRNGEIVHSQSFEVKDIPANSFKEHEVEMPRTEFDNVEGLLTLPEKAE